MAFRIVPFLGRSVFSCRTVVQKCTKGKEGNPCEGGTVHRRNVSVQRLETQDDACNHDEDIGGLFHDVQSFLLVNVFGWPD